MSGNPDSKAMASFRLDKGDKEVAKSVLAAHGMTLTDGIAEYIGHIARTGNVPRFGERSDDMVELGPEGAPGNISAGPSGTGGEIAWELPDGTRGTYSLETGEASPAGALGRRELARLDAFADRIAASGNR